jgi:hypothetical protein
MGEATEPEPVKLICGMLAQGREWLDAARARLAESFGTVDLASDVFTFDVTDYYEPEMGAGLLRQFVSFQRVVSPGDLADIKLATNATEGELAAELGADVPRPVNLDPGLLDGSKLILATTKDYAHRIYLRDGIYAEVTLIWKKGGWTPTPWTYRDYREPTYHAFLTQARARFRERRRGGEEG